MIGDQSSHYTYKTHSARWTRRDRYLVYMPVHIHTQTYTLDTYVYEPIPAPQESQPAESDWVREQLIYLYIGLYILGSISHIYIGSSLAKEEDSGLGIHGGGSEDAMLWKVQSHKNSVWYYRSGAVHATHKDWKTVRSFGGVIDTYPSLTCANLHGSILRGNSSTGLRATSAGHLNVPLFIGLRLL